MADGLTFILGLDKSAFDGGIAAAQRSIKNFAGAIGGYFAISSIKKLIDDFDALGKRADDLGMRASGLVAMREAADHAGVSAEKLDAGLVKLRNGVVNNSEAFAKLGVSLKNADGSAKPFSEVLYETSDKFAEMQGSTESSQAALKLFGEENAVSMQRVLELGSASIQASSDAAKAIDEAAEAAARVNDTLSDASNLVMGTVAKAISAVQYLFDITRSLLSGKSFDHYSMLREQDRMNKKIAKENMLREQDELKRTLDAEKQKQKAAEDTEKKRQDALKNSREIAEKHQFDELSTAEKLAKRKSELAELQKQRNGYDVQSLEYAQAQEKCAKAFVELKALEKKAAAEAAAEDKKRQDIIADTAATTARYEYEQLSTAEKLAAKKGQLNEILNKSAALDANSLEYAQAQNEYAKVFVEMQELEKRNKEEILNKEQKQKKLLEDKKKAEKSLQDLYKQRADIVKQTLDRQQQAQRAMVGRVGSSGGKERSATQTSARKSKQAGEQAEEAFAQGRMGDYARLKRRQEKYEQDAIKKQKGKLDRAAEKALKDGDTDTYKRLKKESENAGLDKDKNKNEMAENVKSIDEKLKEAADNLQTLVEGLK